MILPGRPISGQVIPNIRGISRLDAIESALAKTGGTLAAAAKMLDISRSTLYRKLENYGIARSVDR